MGEEFLKFKKKYFKSALVRALLLGISVTSLVVAIFLFVINFGKVDIGIPLAILVGVALGLLSGLISFFVLHVNDKGVAKKLDSELGLGEKVQTMYAFKDSEGEIVSLQRQNAGDIIINEAGNVKGVFKGLIALIVATVISVGVLGTALVLYFGNKEDNSSSKDKTKIEEPNDNKVPDIPFDATDHHKVALIALIAEVEKSNLSIDAKSAVIVELTKLLEGLDELTTESQMKDTVVDVIKNVRKIINNTNTTYAFNSFAKKSENENLLMLNQALFSLDISKAEGDIDTIRQNIFYDGGTRNSIELLKNDLSALLKNSGIPETDNLYVSTQELQNSLTNIIDNPTYTDDFVIQVLDEAFGVYKRALKEILPQQRVNEDVKIMVVDELMRIFGITEDDLVDKSTSGKVDTEDPEQERPEGDDGGFGTGDAIFGSDDVVFDPESNEYKKYGDIIAKYESQIREMIMNGEISEELAQLLEEYFDVLMTPKDN